jgi:hypothetical protein
MMGVRNVTCISDAADYAGERCVPLSGWIIEFYDINNEACGLHIDKHCRRPGFSPILMKNMQYDLVLPVGR